MAPGRGTYPPRTSRLARAMEPSSPVLVPHLVPPCPPRTQPAPYLYVPHTPDPLHKPAQGSRSAEREMDPRPVQPARMRLPSTDGSFVSTARDGAVALLMATYIARIVSAVTLGRGGGSSPSPADLETIAWRALAGHGPGVS